MERYGTTPRLIAATAVLAALALLAACSHKATTSTNTATSNNPQPAANNPDQVLNNQKADIEQKTNAELNDWDRRIDQLKTDEKSVKGKALKARWKNAVADLDKKRDTVKDRLSDVKSAGADTFQTAENNLNTAESDLKNSYDQVVAKLGKTVTPHLQPETAM
jgi:organic radical activating enzyme